MTAMRLALPLALVGLVGALAATQVEASQAGTLAKPPPAPTATPAPVQPLDGGTIYYRGASGNGLRAMAPNGTGDRAITGVTGMGYTRPSQQLHAGERWYLALRPSSNSWSPGFFPNGADGGRLYDLDLVRESDPLNPIALTSNGGACIQMWADHKMYDWAADANGLADGAVSWLGTRWADDNNDGTCDRVLDGGVFRATLTIAADGAVTFTQPTSPEVVVGLAGNETQAEAFDWSPGGDAVSYVIHSGSQMGLWVASATGASRIYSSWANLPDWSPDQDTGASGQQTQIAFHGVIGGASSGNYATYVVSPNGSGLAEVARGALAKRSTPAVYNMLVQWSPAGSHLAYVEASSAGWKLRTVQRNGGNNSVLLNPVGWLNGWARD